MGTNYYLKTGSPCPTCGHHPNAERHIGKSSAGWCFSLHVDPDNGIASLDDWRRLWSEPGAAIEDEYGQSVSAEEMADIITDRGRSDPLGWDAAMLARNSAVEGPNNLARHRIDGRFCIGHGDGTWDLLVGEFS